MNIFIVNGAPGSGKTTFEHMVQELLGKHKVFILSTIDPIKKMAEQIGWKGSKTPKDRKFLSDLKDLVTEYNDGPMNYIKDELRFIHNIFKSYDVPTDQAVVFIDIREPHEIARAVNELGAKTILIKRPIVEEISNHADANVESYQYDYVIKNYEDKTYLEQLAEIFIKENITRKDLV